MFFLNYIPRGIHFRLVDEGIALGNAQQTTQDQCSYPVKQFRDN